MRYGYRKFKKRKSRKVIGAVILFAFALSSCKECKVIDRETLDSTSFDYGSYNYRTGEFEYKYKYKHSKPFLMQEYHELQTQALYDKFSLMRKYHEIETQAQALHQKMARDRERAQEEAQYEKRFIAEWNAKNGIHEKANPYPIYRPSKSPFQPQITDAFSAHSADRLPTTSAELNAMLASGKLIKYNPPSRRTYNEEKAQALHRALGVCNTPSANALAAPARAEEEEAPAHPLAHTQPTAAPQTEP